MKKPILILIVILVFLSVACGPDPTATLEVCAISGLLPIVWCASKIKKTFKKGMKPTAPCNICHEPTVRICDETGKRAVRDCLVHEVPQSEAPVFYCRRHARNALASPWLVMAWMDLQSKVQRFTEEEFDIFARRVGEAGVRYIRITYPGWNDYHPAGVVLPYEQEADGRWNLLRPNPAYDENLHRLAVAFGRYEVGLYVDMADQCSGGNYWDCWGWGRNINDVKGWSDESALALAHWKAAVDRVLLAIGGAEGNIIGLGNELDHGNAADLTWVIAWAKPRVDCLIGLGIQKPITFSGAGETAHKILGAVSNEDGIYPDNSYICLINHGVGLVDHVPPGFGSLQEWLKNHSEVRLFGYSDDGTDTAPWSYIPPEKAGTYDKSGRKCALVEEKIKLLKVEVAHFGNRLKVIEFLPREISFDEGPGSLAEQSLEAFWRVGLEVLGIDIRRTL